MQGMTRIKAAGLAESMHRIETGCAKSRRATCQNGIIGLYYNFSTSKLSFPRSSSTVIINEYQLVQSRRTAGTSRKDI